MNAWIVILATGGHGRVTGFTRLKAMQQGFEQQTDYTTMFAWILVLLGLIGLAIVLTQVANREPATPKNPQERYFEKAMRMLQLSRREIRILRQIARRAGLAQPAVMLLTPLNLQTAIDAAMLPSEQPRLRQEAEALGRRLFGPSAAAA
jgi:hypothetical protein